MSWMWLIQFLFSFEPFMHHYSQAAISAALWFDVLFYAWQHHSD
jgi:hypothetical protein